MLTLLRKPKLAQVKRNINLTADKHEDSKGFNLFKTNIDVRLQFIERNKENKINWISYLSLKFSALPRSRSVATVTRRVFTNWRMAKADRYFRRDNVKILEKPDHKALGRFRGRGEDHSNSFRCDTKFVVHM